jgi:hypothetical protein
MAAVTGRFLPALLMLTLTAVRLRRLAECPAAITCFPAQRRGAPTAVSSASASTSATALAVTDGISGRWPGGGYRRRCPRRDGRLRRFGGRVQQRIQCRHSGDAVGDGVMGVQQQAHPVGRQAGYEPRLPEWPARTQSTSVQLRTHGQQLGLIGRSRQRVDPDMIGDVEGRCVDLQRPAQPPPRPVQQLPQPGNQVQPAFNSPAHRLDPHAAVTVQRPAAVQDREYTARSSNRRTRPGSSRTGHCLRPVNASTSSTISNGTSRISRQRARRGRSHGDPPG